MKMDIQTILVTGGTGFIGSKLVARLCKDGFKVKVLTRSPINNDSSVDYIVGDISKASDVISAACGVDVIFHLAAAMGGEWSDHQRITIDGTNNVIDACKKHSIKHLIYISTINVYDSNAYEDDMLVSEFSVLETHGELRGNYSYAKLIAEEMVLKNSKDTQLYTSIIRPGLVYGNKENMLPKDVVIRLFKSLYIMIGRGDRRLPLIYVDNLVDALVLTLTQDAKKTNIYNVVDDAAPTQKSYLSIYNKYTKNKMYVIYLPKILVMLGATLIDVMCLIVKRKKSYIRYRMKTFFVSPVFNTKFIKEDLGWSQKVNLDDAIKNTVSS